MSKRDLSNVTPLPTDRLVRRVSNDRYISSEFMELEREKIFSRAWIMVCPEWRLAKPGSYVTLDELDQSILILRDDSSQIRAFHNVCRHRGTRLLSKCGKVEGIQCPYHGWRYRLDGTLDRITKADGFSEKVEHGSFGLKRVRSASWLGFVWVNLSPEAPELHETLGGLDEELAPYQLHDMRPVQSFERIVPFNWKVMLENAMDFYHVPFVHKGTINPQVSEGPDLTSYGDHTRQRLDIASRYRWRQRLDRSCTRGGPYTEKQVRALHKYLIFPNFLINVLPYHLTVMQVFPVEAQRCRLRYSFCYRRGAKPVERLRAVATWAASRAILREDLKILHSVQRGFATGQVPVQALHQEEEAASHFHTVLNRWTES